MLIEKVHTQWRGRGRYAFRKLLTTALDSINAFSSGIFFDMCLKGLYNVNIYF